jgi:ABC-type transport system involved in cytochrome c biogenesis ATPase subunit
MLEYLRLRNVGPALGMDLELAPRLNLITGDNGLGKSFLLDVIWWALTRKWPQEVNPHMNAGYAARPAAGGEDATIRFRARGRRTSAQYEARYVARDQAWRGGPGRPLVRALVIYAHTDGSFSYWDPARNYWRRRGDADFSERRPAQVFTQDEVWNGAYMQENGRRVPICNGLIIDWAAWISAQNDSHDTMKAVIETLASDGTGIRVEPGGLARISIDDPRDIPTIRTGYAEAIPILHASAGIRRVVALAYMLTLAWREHRLAAEQLGELPCDRVVLLIDEAESHLHPRWQRSILSSLTVAMRKLGTPEAVQMVVTTHSPLVLSSAEAWFDEERDAWFDLDLENESGVVLRRRTYERRGAVGHWLTSDAFDLLTDRGSIEAERVVLRARELLSGEEPSLEEVEEVGRKLGEVLSISDPFLAGWGHFRELLREKRATGQQ